MQRQYFDAWHLEHVLRAFSGGHAIALGHTGMHPNVRLGETDLAPGNEIFPLKIAISYYGVHTGKVFGQLNFHFKTYLLTP